MRCKKTVLILEVIANAVVVLGQTTTVTLFELELEGLGWGGITVVPEGVNTDGETTYSFGIPITAARTRGGQTITPTETWRGTLVQDAFHHIVTAGPTSTDDLGAYGNCQFSYSGGACAWQAWSSGGTTESYTITGAVVPFYTLVVVPTSVPSTSHTTPTSAVVVTTTSTLPSSTTPSASSPIHKSSTGAIIGAILGSLAVVALVAFLFFYRIRARRGSRRNREVFDPDTYPMPFYDGLESRPVGADGSTEHMLLAAKSKTSDSPTRHQPTVPTQTRSSAGDDLDSAALRSELNALRAAVEGLNQPPRYEV